MTGLRRHIPELAIEWAACEPGRLWRAIDGTLCFADISGFTALSEKLTRRGRIGGEELVETLSRVFGAMLERARERDGTLLKFGGDALLFLFEGQDHATRAASAAVEMRAALREARKIPTSVGPLRLSMSVGLHSGTLHFFLVGSTHRELVLAGPDASMAAAVESAANANEIGISPATAALLPAPAVRPREDGLLLLRWRKPPAPPPGPGPRTAAGDEVLRSLFPRTLGEVLARGAPEPEHRVACIAFVRFSGTDRLLEEQGPDAVAAALDATIGTAQRILETEDVTLLAVDIDKDGGKLFLSSGVPLATEDDEGRMLRALRRLADTPTPLALQLGVNRGHVFAAEIGTSWRAAYSAMGDTTNTAARICSKAQPGELYAHPSVLEHSRTRFATEPVGPFTFKGKKVPQVLYRVGEETGVAADGAEDRLPLVGRRDEFGVLIGALDALATGIGGVVSIEGAAGLGKSRLLRAALERLEGLPVLQLRAESYGTASPYRVFRDPLRSLLGVGQGDAAALRRQLTEGVERTAPDLLPYLALLGEIAQIEVEPSPEIATIEPRFRQDRIADTVLALLDAGLEGPRVIVMEDAHWADGASAHLLRRLAAACTTRPWLMLVARRPDAGGFAVTEGRQLELQPMPDGELAEFVNEVTAAMPLRPYELSLVVRRSSGNPLFAAEMVRAAREAGSFEAVPDSLEATIAARVDALDPEARRVLRYATVLGSSFSLRHLQGLLKTEGLDVDTAVLARLEAFLAPDGDDGWRFRVGLLRQTVYEGLAFRLRLRLHREAGEMIERLAADPATKADHLALHFSKAGDHERTWRYARLAADRAAKAYANADAARLYRMALDVAGKLSDVDPADRVRTWTTRGNVCALADLFDEALHAYREAHRLTGDDPVSRAELLRLRAVARERAGAFTRAVRDLSAARRLLEGLDTPQAGRTRARLQALTAMIRYGQERYPEAIETGRAAAEAARAVGNKEALAQALAATGLAESFTGLGGTERMQEALRIYEELGDLSSEAMVRNNLGVGAFLEGRWDQALSWYESAAAAKLKAGNPVGAAGVLSNCGELYARQGRLDEAEPILRNAVRVMRASGFHDGAAYAEVQLGRVLIGRGELKQAEESLRRTGAELAQLGLRSSALEAALVQALALVHLGRAAEALPLVDRADEAAGGAAGYLAAQAAEARALTLTALNRYEEAAAEIARGLDTARKQGLRYEEGMLLRARAALAKATGREPDPADEAQAAKIMEALGVETTPSAP